MTAQTTCRFCGAPATEANPIRAYDQVCEDVAACVERKWPKKPEQEERDDDAGNETN